MVLLYSVEFMMFWDQRVFQMALLYSVKFMMYESLFLSVYFSPTTL